MSTDTNRRLCSIELLRIFLMIGIIIMHFDGYIGYAGEYAKNLYPATYYTMFFFDRLFAPAVDTFLLITGFFMIGTERRNLWKPIKLIFEVVFFRELFFCLEGIVQGNLNFKEMVVVFLPRNYYAIQYVVLYVLSHYIDIIYNHVKMKAYLIFTVLSVVVFSIWTSCVDFLDAVFGTSFSVGGLNPMGLNGSGGGYTLMNFALMYIIGGALKYETQKSNNDGEYDNGQWLQKLPSQVIMLILLISLIIETVFYLNIKTFSTGTYHTPLTILNAVCLFLLFYRFGNKVHRKNNENDRKWASIAINGMAKSVFVVFLTHGYFLKSVKADWIISANPFVTELKKFGVAIGIYVCCSIVYVVYQFFERRLFDKFRDIFGPLTINWTGE